MPWDKNEEEAFPARHPREPGGLRQDILDEIADHLACAAAHERDRDNEGNEETIWDRVLERFGNPDTVARRLWWDQMKETVMREWIQTGVQAVLAVAGVAGIALLFMVMGRMNENNEALRTAMDQANASNAALRAAITRMADRGNGAAVTPSGGSEVEILVRRGSPDGAPAPEVQVELRGKGPNDDVVAVDGVLDESGRTAFSELAQGNYTIGYYDPVSNLYAVEELTLFAGSGAGERVVVAPDVNPREFTLDWGLPPYGADKLRIKTLVVGRWQHDDLAWSAMVEVVSGPDGTHALGPVHGHIQELESHRIVEPISEMPSRNVRIAGDITVAGSCTVLRQEEDGSWDIAKSVNIDGDIQLWKGAEVLTISARGDPVPVEQTNGVAAGREVWRAKLAPGFRESYTREARKILNLRSAFGKAHESLAHRASRGLESMQVVDGALVTERALVRMEEGFIYQPMERYEQIVSSALTSPVEVASHGALFSLPGQDNFSANASLCLAVPVEYARKSSVRRNEDRPDRVHFSTQEDNQGNVLAAYLIRSPWAGRDLAEYTDDSASEGIPLQVDDNHFWQVDSEDIDDTLFISCPVERLRDTENPPTGVLLRFERNTEDYQWSLVIPSAEEGEAEVAWIATEPLPGTGDKPLEDIDGRFHYDSIRGRDVELTPSRDVR